MNQIISARVNWWPGLRLWRMEIVMRSPAPKPSAVLGPFPGTADRESSKSHSVHLYYLLRKHNLLAARDGRVLRSLAPQHGLNHVTKRENPPLRWLPRYHASAHHTLNILPAFGMPHPLPCQRSGGTQACLFVDQTQVLSETSFPSGHLCQPV